MEPNVFLGYLEKGIVHVLWPNEGIAFLLDLVGLCNTFQIVEKYDMEPNLF